MEEDEEEGGKDSAASSIRSTRSGRTNNGSTKGQKKAAARSRTKGAQAAAAVGASGGVKGKGRRHIFKKRAALKAPAAVARAITSDRVFFRVSVSHSVLSVISYEYVQHWRGNPQGQYFQKGDIVSMTDVDGGTFYAQLRGFLTDQYCEKSAVLTWLLPTTNSPPPDEVHALLLTYTRVDRQASQEL